MNARVAGLAALLLAVTAVTRPVHSRESARTTDQRLTGLESRVAGLTHRLTVTGCAVTGEMLTREMNNGHFFRREQEGA